VTGSQGRNTLNASNTSLATAPASPEARRRTLVFCAALFAAFCALAPFARVSLLRIEPFIPVYESVFALNCLVTTGLLLFGFARSRLRAVLALASGYLFTSLAAVAQMLTFPGLFSSSGLLGAGPRTSAWFDVFRHCGLPLAVICYALLKRRHNVSRRSPGDVRSRIISAAAVAVAGFVLLALLVTAGHRLLPQLVAGDGYTGVGLATHATVCLLSVAALAVLGLLSRYSILDLWLMVVVCAWIFAVVLGMVVNTGGFDVGFYAGRLYGLFAVSIGPVALLVGASRIAGQLDEALAIAEQRNVELARSREELAQAQRLEAIGQLTGGVAHDFNNLLTVVIGNLEMILDARGDRAKIDRLAQNAIKAAQRGEHLVRQLLTYARRQISRPQTVDVNQLIANIENLIRRVIGEQIEVVTILSPGLAPVQIDTAQFETAILNLVINSRDAMAGGGRIIIETREVTLDRQDVIDPEAAPGPYVRIAVSDTGAGMTAAVLARAFDPFFTTKEVGKGSGLGLSQVYGFVKTAGGHVQIKSELGAGTTVELYLPKSSALAAPAETVAERQPAAPASGRATILMVEDDEEVLAVTAESLRELGYQVVTAVTAAQALDILRSDQPVDLLFSDVVIPGGADGAQLAVEARRVRPRLKVLLTSGYAAAALSLEHGLPDTLEFVGKPYEREELAHKVRLAIEG
jgi:signal transduction histidine kinase